MSLLETFNICDGSGWITAGRDVQYKVVDGTLYFQCSRTASDWRYNLKAARDVYKSSDIEFVAHRGFNELWESVRHDIEALTFTRICGYSQGAALAVLAHENYFHRFGYEPGVTITFGCPPSIKSPSRALAARFSHLVNWHNPWDIVYYLPALLGYRHIGTCNTLRGAARRPRVCKLLTWLSGHSPDEYRQRLSCIS